MKANHLSEQSVDVDLKDLMSEDEFFIPIMDRMNELTQASELVGLCPDQVEEFIEKEVNPILARYKLQDAKSQLNVWLMERQLDLLAKFNLIFCFDDKLIYLMLNLFRIFRFCFS